MENKYRFEHVHDIDSTKVIYETDAVGADELIRAFRDFLLGCGFSPVTIDEYFNVD